MLWNFYGAEKSKFARGEDLRIGCDIYRVVFRIGTWHWLRRE